MISNDSNFTTLISFNTRQPLGLPCGHDVEVKLPDLPAKAA
jgi:hypothetical protein